MKSQAYEMRKIWDAGQDGNHRISDRIRDRGTSPNIGFNRSPSGSKRLDEGCNRCKMKSKKGPIYEGP